MTSFAIFIFFVAYVSYTFHLPKFYLTISLLHEQFARKKQTIKINMKS